MIEQAIQAYVEEARDLLANLEDQLLALEVDPDPATINEIFRALHTIKGSGAMFGYTALARFTHHFESAFELVRASRLSVSSGLIDLSLKARDLMVSFLDLGGDGDDAEALLISKDTSSIVNQLAEIAGNSDAPATGAEEEQRQDDQKQGRTSKTMIWTIRFRPDERALLNGMRPEGLIRELAGLGNLTTHFHDGDVPPLSEIDPECAYLTWIVRLEGTATRADIEDVFIFADDAQLTIEETPNNSTSGDTESEPGADARIEPATVQKGAEVAESPEIDAQENSDDAAKGSGSAPQPAAGSRPRADASRESIRVASSRLDEMMDSLGELVIAQARLDAVAGAIGDATLEGVVEEVQRLILGLRDATLSIRMLPIETVFGKFRRVVRDLSTELGKDVRLVTEGGDTEVDKNVIDRIADPLVHMIRNSMDHGFEQTSERRDVGKSANGTLRLSASQDGGEILIAVEDDGRGLNLEAIRKKAEDNGLISEGETRTDRELRMLIFEPGFSTAREISAVSGRGVGMDAVKSAVDALGGNVDITSSPGKGTRFTLRLPVSLAIIDGLRVRLGGSVYVIPLSAVDECVEMSPEDAGRTSGRSVLEIREKMVPYLALDDLFGQPSDPVARRRVVVVRVDGSRIGLVVDDILGQGQTVIKSLSHFHRDIPGLAGATILGDGQVALIIDVASLVRWAGSSNLDPRKAA